jgi:ABC-type Zn uptake system ZnuABC Zn-binding protein ZnuA
MNSVPECSSPDDRLKKTAQKQRATGLARRRVCSLAVPAGVWLLYILSLGVLASTAACSTQPVPSGANGKLIVTSTTILADITGNLTGGRIQVESLIPFGMDPHAFQPVPADAVRISNAAILIVNGAGYESFLEPLLESAAGGAAVVEASAGLPGGGIVRPGEVDPHFWLDPTEVIHYVENIRDALAAYEPAGEAVYSERADAYIQKLTDLDSWITVQVEAIPQEQRLLFTNHEALGHFAARYGFRIAGSILTTVGSDASVSARDLGRVVDEIRARNVRVIFLDDVEGNALARQVASETGVQIVDNLHLESLTDGPPAATYVEMMRYNVRLIVDALEQ